MSNKITIWFWFFFLNKKILIRLKSWTDRLTIVNFTSYNKNQINWQRKGKKQVRETVLLMTLTLEGSPKLSWHEEIKTNLIFTFFSLFFSRKVCKCKS